MRKTTAEREAESCLKEAAKAINFDYSPLNSDIMLFLENIFIYPSKTKAEIAKDIVQYIKEFGRTY